MRFALVIPALNEEEAIAAILRRSLAARSKVTAQTPVTEMRIVFVNDGCTDRTQEIVDQAEFDEVVKVRFDKNRGYGAAIQAGFRATDAELVGFIDADGTWDPDFCVPLLQRLLASGADVVLANRMNPESRMPPVRKLGNWIFARLLTLLSGKRLADSASGFRVLRRSSLARLAPLPDRLHFTPAMSSLCVMDDGLRIEEVPLRYEERIGRSKLSVLRDGLRFLDVMLFTAVYFRPGRMLGALALALVAVAGALAAILRAFDRSGAALLAGLGGSLLAVFAVWTGRLIRRIRHAMSDSRRGEPPSDHARLAGWGVALILAGVLGILGSAARAPEAWRDGPGIGPLAWSAPALLLLLLGGALAFLGLLTRVTVFARARADARSRDEFRPASGQGT